MTMPADAGARTQQVDQSIPCCLGAGIGAGMSRGAGAIQFARRNTRQPDAWRFFAPDGAITIPNVGGRAGEYLTSGNG